MTLRGRPIISWIEKDKNSNRINVAIDQYGNRSILSFDRICFKSFVQALDEYSEKGKISQRASESCQGQVSLESFLFDLSGDKNFSVNFDLGDVRSENCFVKIKSDHAGLFLFFNEDQMRKIMFKFKRAVDVKEALKEAEEKMTI
ncbi:hypothetical protein ES705_12935 [subsurface metagenome]